MKTLFTRFTTALSLTSILLGSASPLAMANTNPPITSQEITNKLQALRNIDLAVDAASNVVFVIKTTEQGAIHIVDIATEKETGKIEARSDEIELSNGKLYSLSKGAEKSTIDTFIRNSGEWVKASETVINTENLSDIKGLHAEADGSITLNAFDNNRNENVVVVYSDHGTNSLSEQDRVSTAEIQAKMSEDSMIQIVDSKATDPAKKTTYQSGKGAGFTAGLLTGLGFAFREFFGNGWGLSIGAGGLSSNGSVDANAGVEIMKVLDEKEKMRFYALMGVSSFYSRTQQWRQTNPDPAHPEYVTGETYFASDASYNFGVGLGIEWAPAGFANNGISFAFELPLAVSLKHVESQGVSFLGIRPIPSISIVYYFKH